MAVPCTKTLVRREGRMSSDRPTVVDGSNAEPDAAARVLVSPAHCKTEVNDARVALGKTTGHGAYAKMARRYSRPVVHLCTRKDGSKFWETRFWRYELQPDGMEKRTHPRVIVGSFEDFPTKRLAEREAQRVHDEAAKSYTPVEPTLTGNPASAFILNPKATTLFEVVADWWEKEILPINRKFSTRETARFHLSKWLKPNFGKMPIGDVRADVVQAFFKKMATGGASPKLMRNVRNTLAKLLEQARAKEYIVHNPLSGLELPKYKPVKKQAYTVEQVAGILSKAPERYRMLFYLCAETGLRAGEVAGLRVPDVDLANRTIGVSRAVWRGHEDSPKTDAGVRRFAISARLSEMLAKQIDGRTSGPMFASRNGTPVDMHNVCNRELRKARRDAGVEYGDMHTFRHFNATVMDSLHIPMAVRRMRLGHADGSITDGYTSAVKQDDRDAAEKISALIEEKLESLYPDCTLAGYTLTSVHA